jgi:hypothetical protein
LKTNLFTKQKAIPFIGVFKQLFGGAITWATMAIFMFSGMTAWNTPTMDWVRSIIPWLSLPVFITIIVAGIILAMYLEHKFIQPSVMVYWNKMNYDHANPIRKDLKRIEDKIDKLSK